VAIWRFTQHSREAAESLSNRRLHSNYLYRGDGKREARRAVRSVVSNRRDRNERSAISPHSSINILQCCACSAGSSWRIPFPLATALQSDSFLPTHSERESTGRERGFAVVTPQRSKSRSSRLGDNMLTGSVFQKPGAFAFGNDSGPRQGRARRCVLSSTFAETATGHALPMLKRAKRSQMRMASLHCEKAMEQAGDIDQHVSGAASSTRG